MDVGFYLGELLMQQGEVSVPGLGYFVQARISAYYNESEGKLYPPAHQVQFDEQLINDDALTEYIALKKNISLESALYFIEKYVSGLKQQALTEQVAVGNLGWFYTENDTLLFKPADKIINDAAFYGQQPVNASKQETITEVKDIITQPQQEPETDKEQEPANPVIQILSQPEPSIPDYDELADIYEEENTGNPLRTLLIIVTILLIIGSGLLTLYTYDIATFNRLKFWERDSVTTPIAVKPDTTKKINTDTVNTDTLNTALKDTTVTATRVAVPIVIDTTAKVRYELIAVSSINKAEASKAIIALQKAGFNDAKVVTDAPKGKRVLITIGSFKTWAQGKAASVELIKAKKISADAYIQEIKKAK